MFTELLQAQDKYFHKNHTRSYAFRMHQLDVLKKGIQKYEKKIIQALYDDLRKPEFEAYTNEVGFVLESIRYSQRHLRRWMKKVRVKTPLHQFGSRSYIEQVPYGKTLIIGPFNYPFQLLIEPLIGAIAAGNTAVIKPSEYTKSVEGVLKTMIEEIFDPQYIALVTGEIKETTALLAAPFDYIFFTGSVGVGKIVMEAAAKRLTPLTLELGGKSPVIVDQTAKIDLAAKRIAWGKFLNAGQTCVAPDYVYVHKDVMKPFKAALKKHIEGFYGPRPEESEDYGRIVSQRHYQRLKALISEDSVFVGGQSRDDSLYIAPTVLEGLTWDAPVMKDEIFGPILPLLAYEDLDQVLDEMKGFDKPLALYIFSENRVNQNKILNQLSFGGGAINDTISHVASPYLPFGGVQTSGLGLYHGHYSFKAFSHTRSLVNKSTKLDIKLVFPPYGDKIKLARKFMK